MISLEERASRWADEKSRSLAAEEKARATVILPLCKATWSLRKAEDIVAREKESTPGAADPEALRSAEELVRGFQAEIYALTPRYEAYRHHPFDPRCSEGVCVVERARELTDAGGDAR